jgi:hypothetical protein
MGVDKIRRRAAVRGTLTIGANGDSGLQRMAANVIGPLTGDTLAVNSGTAAIGTADLGGVAGAIVLRQQAAGSPCIAFRNSSGTVYSLYFAAGGGAVTGTPVTA